MLCRRAGGVRAGPGGRRHLQDAVRRLPRFDQPARAHPRRAAADAGRPHPARARGRRDDERGAHDESRGAPGGRRLPRSAGRRRGAAAVRLLRGPHHPARGQARGHVERLEPRYGQHAVSGGRRGRPQRRSGPAPEAEMGVRLRRRRVGVFAADGAGRTPVRRQRRGPGPRHARRQRLSRVDVPGQRPGARRPPGRARRRQARAAVRRHDRLVLRAAGGDRGAVVEGPRGGTRLHASDRGGDGARRCRLRAGLVVGGSARRRSAISLLHVPGQCRRAPDQRRPAAVEDVPGRARPGARQDHDGRGGVRPVRRRRLVDAHGGRQARPAVCGHRRQLLGAGHVAERRRGRAGSEDRPHRLVEAVHRR